MKSKKPVTAAERMMRMPFHRQPPGGMPLGSLSGPTAEPGMAAPYASIAASRMAAAVMRDTRSENRVHSDGAGGGGGGSGTGRTRALLEPSEGMMLPLLALAPELRRALEMRAAVMLWLRVSSASEAPLPLLTGRSADVLD